MKFYKYNPKTGKTIPKLEENEIRLDIAEYVGKELGQDLVKIQNAKIIIKNLVKKLRKLENKRDIV